MLYYNIPCNFVKIIILSLTLNDKFAYLTIIPYFVNFKDSVLDYSKFDIMKTLMRIITILLLCATMVQAQSENQIIVQLHESSKVADLTSTHRMYKGQNTGLHSKKLLSKRLNIWLLEFDEKKADLRDMLLSVRTSDAVTAAQANHPVAFRTDPNDELYGSQWQYDNDGSGDGTADADIDAPQAWDLTTGGTTVMGDEIVIAVVDGGVNMLHPDLANNIWTNKDEIPANGIDDDNNGYIDDMHGWNFNDDTNDITNDEEGNWHGSPVMGILGASGDNEAGVSGVNWNVKVINMVGNQSDETVISAYAYILDLRKKYNDTDGEEGAFIVTTNASLGRNGFPEDAPVWCAIYDALGDVGIISAGATANSWTNVDIDGDIPTSCPSDYLITVTNTNKRDQKAISAGYGSISIDLGAPGSESFTVKNSGDYGVFGGTSASTPHVAGAAALLYAMPVPAFMEDVRQDPKDAARRVKNFILQGVDEIPDLQETTVSGGRLNLYNSLVNLEDYYGIEGDVFPKKAVFISNIYPNPTTDDVSIEIKLYDTTVLTVKVFNSLGQQVNKKSFGKVDRGLHRANFSFKDFPIGMYYITASADSFGSIGYEKVIVK